MCEVITKEKVNLPGRITMVGVVSLRQPVDGRRPLKIGVKLGVDQDLETFGLTVHGKDLTLIPDKAPFPWGAELQAAFAPNEHEVWSGYFAEPCGDPEVDAIETRLTVNNFHIPSYAFQSVPVVFAYAEETLGIGGYFLAVHVLSGIDALDLRARIDDTAES